MFHKQASAIASETEEGEDLIVCPGTFRIQRSLFSTLTGKLTRTFQESAAGRKVFTWSAWVKRTARNPNWSHSVYPNSVTEPELMLIPVTNDSNNYARIAFNTEFKDQTNGSALSNPDIVFLLNRNNGTTNTHTVRNYHPPDGTWDHVMVVYNTPLPTTTDRVRYYLNGNEISGRYSNWPSQDDTTHINRALVHDMLEGYTGYIAEINFVDGQALDPTAFGQQCDLTGRWEPIEPQVSDYGTNGFRLEFLDGTDIGKDTSGKNNHWTPVGLDSHNISIDTPTHRPAVKNILKSIHTKANGLISKTFPAHGNRRVWTMSWWFKSMGTGAAQFIHPFLDGNRYSRLQYDAYDPFNLMINNRQLTNNDVFIRAYQSNHEPTSGAEWFHFVISSNTTHSIASERTKCWVNGVLDPCSAGTTPPQNTEWWINSNVAQRLLISGNYLAAEIIFVDGKVLDPTAFGYKNTDTGEWYPREYEGYGYGPLGYGANGYHLEFLDPANLGKDTSGHGNDFAVTVYTSADLSDDTPTNPI